MVPEVGIAPTSPRLQRGANLSQLLGELACQAVAGRRRLARAEPKLGERRLVVPRGNAPRSSAYQGRSALELQDGKVNREALG